MSGFADPFLAAYLRGSDQGLDLAQTVERQRLLREQQAMNQDQFNRDLQYKMDRNAVDDARASEYLKVQQAYLAGAQERQQRAADADAMEIAQQRAAQRFNVGRFGELMPDRSVGSFVKAAMFGGMDPRTQAGVLDDMEQQKQTKLDEMMRQRALNDVRKQRAAYEAFVAKAGGYENADKDKAVGIAVAKIAALDAAELQLTTKIQGIASAAVGITGKTPAFQSQSSRGDPYSTAGTVQMRAKLLDLIEQYERALQSPRDPRGYVSLGVNNYGEPNWVPVEHVQRLLAGANAHFNALLRGGVQRVETGDVETPAGMSADDKDMAELETLNWVVKSKE